MVDIAIIDCGMGNLQSIRNGLGKVGLNSTITFDKKEINESDALILPGVGAFGDAVRNLKTQKELIIDQADAGKPILGICLGMQLFLTESEEKGSHLGLNLIEGNVIQFPKGMKIPHMGWNQVKIQNNHPIVEGIPKDAYFYFVHSYFCNPKNTEDIIAKTDYNIEFASIIGRKNIIGTQFHPEKSAKYGLKILSNFKTIIKK